MKNTDELKRACEMYVISTYVEKAQERMLTQLLNKLSELERLAEIGSTTEKAFENGLIFVDKNNWKIWNTENLFRYFKED